jgi:hypothetical protein
MDYDVGDLLESLFGGTVPTTAAVVVQYSALPEVADVPTMIVDPEETDLGEVPDFDSLPEPGKPCPVCGSLETWWDMRGGEHCQHCERPTLDKAIDWADRAARLREQPQPRKPALPIAPGCVSGGMVDTLDLGSGKPLQPMLEGFVAV